MISGWKNNRVNYPARATHSVDDGFPPPSSVLRLFKAALQAREPIRHGVEGAIAARRHLLHRIVAVVEKQHEHARGGGARATFSLNEEGAKARGRSRSERTT